MLDGWSLLNVRMGKVGVGLRVRCHRSQSIGNGFDQGPSSLEAERESKSIPYRQIITAPRSSRAVYQRGMLEKPGSGAPVIHSSAPGAVGSSDTVGGLSAAWRGPDPVRRTIVRRTMRREVDCR